MITEEKNGLKLFKFEGLAGETGLVHAVTTRRGGISPEPYASLNLGFGTKDLPENAVENLKLVCAAMDLPFGKTVRMRQAHTANVRVIGPGFGSRSVPTGAGQYKSSLMPVSGDKFGGTAPQAPEATDALVTNLKGVPLLALSADCALTVLYDPVRSVLGVAHSGWRGAMLNVCGAAAAVMKLQFGTMPGDLIAGVSPMISAENYPVKDDLLEKLKMFYPDDVVRKCLLTRAGRHHFSLKDLLKSQLVALGVKNYEFAHMCTYANEDLFYSWRRDGEQAGRFGLIAMLK